MAPTGREYGYIGFLFCDQWIQNASGRRVLLLLGPRGPEKKSEPTKAALPGSQTFALSAAEPAAPAGGTSAPAKQPGVAPVPPA